MKSVLISIQPKWVELIASGKKTIEVRKTRPKIDTPFKCYIYQTRKPISVMFSGTGKHISEYDKTYCYNKRSGKVIGEFVCDRIEEYTFFTNLAKFSNMGLPCGTFSSYLIFEDDYKKMCLSYDEVKKYGKGATLYGWHISDLVIYDKPKELSEFQKPTMPTGLKWENNSITRPPQSWCYVEEKEN